MVSTALVNKAVYTAALVGDGWAEAENLKKVISDGQMDRRTDRPTDGTKSGLKSRMSAT